MNSSLPQLDQRLAALRESVAHEVPPASTDRAIDQALRRARKRGGALGARKLPAWADRWITLPLALAAAIAVIAFVVRSMPQGAPATDRVASSTMASARTSFIPLVPAAEIGRTTDAMLVPTRVPRTSLAELGWPIDPARAADDVDAELLVRGDGAVLAVRFIN